MKICLIAAASLGALLLSSTASAQTAAKPAGSIVTSDYTEQRVEGGSVVTFPGDELPGDPNDPYGGVVRVPPRVLRVGLIRPRMNFVPELLKSVENL
jgi:hypothetical protein